LIAQFPEAPTFGDFALRFSQTSGRGKGFGDGLALHLASQSKIWAVARITGSVTMTVGIPTTATGSGNGTRAHVAQLGDLGLNGGATAFQIGQRAWHV
jgi:hypothetical protein